MTARQIFEYALIELNKLQAPSLLLEDYNYFINKAILNYITLRYNIYDVNQQSTDDLRVLKGTSVLTSLTKEHTGTIHQATYTGSLPSDYFHLLNCVVEYIPTRNFLCYDVGKPVYFGAKRLTADLFSQVITNFYMKPSYKNPYYYLHNISDPTVSVNPTAPNIPEIGTNNRYGNPSLVKIEIRYGTDDSVFQLSRVLIDYLKVPRHVRLTQAQVDTTVDNSQVLEYPDYVCQEIIKELVKLLMENASDPRLQTNPLVNQTVAPPPQMQQEQRR
jgi:hypothetical protein